MRDIVTPADSRFTAASSPHWRSWVFYARLAVLLCLLTTAAVYEAARVSALFNDDIWGHLRIGAWILDNHAVPRTGLFSQLSNTRWVDSSWGYDLLAGVANRVLGLRAIPVMLMCSKAALAAVIFLLAMGAHARFWTAALLSAAGQYAMAGLQPGPIDVSIIFSGIELLLILQYRRTGNPRSLSFLPLLFLLWANLHIEFVDGLLLLGLVVLVVFAEGLLRWPGVHLLESRPVSSLARIAPIAVLSLVATFLTPYTFHLFGQILQEPYTPTAVRYFTDMRAMSFRQPQHYLLLVMIMSAFFALGRQRSRDLFKIALLVTAALVALRFQRDIWCVVFATIAILADALGTDRLSSGKDRAGLPWELPIAAMLAIPLLAVAGSVVPGNRYTVMQRVSNAFPVKACDFIQANHLPGPLFNAYPWGGFLMWYMPDYPVSIDGRIGLYGDELLTQHFRTVSGNQLLELDPSFANAGTVLLERQSGIARALTTIPLLKAQYRVLYSDDVAIVVQRK
jgi:hypothetical protein